MAEEGVQYQETFQLNRLETMRQAVASKLPTVLRELEKSEKLYEYPNAVVFENGTQFTQAKESTLAKAVKRGIDAKLIAIGVGTRITDKPYRVTTIANVDNPEEKTLALEFNPQYAYKSGELQTTIRKAVLELGYKDHELASKGVKLTPHKMKSETGIHLIRIHN